MLKSTLKSEKIESSRMLSVVTLYMTVDSRHGHEHRDRPRCLHLHRTFLKRFINVRHSFSQLIE